MTTDDSASKAPADPAPAVWIQSDHLEKARHAPFLCRVEPTRRLPDFVPLYTHPAAPAIEQLMRENFTLAAGQCIVDGGLVMGEYGHGVCTMKERVEQLVRERDEALALLREARGWVNQGHHLPAGFQDECHVCQRVARIDAALGAKQA